MYMAGRLIYRGRQWYIGFGCLNPFAELWRCIDTRAARRTCIAADSPKTDTGLPADAAGVVKCCLFIADIY
jgi:hypothetical protein